MWWLRGGVIAFLAAMPIITLVIKEDKKGSIAMTIMSINLGSFIGIVGHFLYLM